MHLNPKITMTAGARLAMNPDVVSDILRCLDPFADVPSEELQSTSITTTNSKTLTASPASVNRNTLLSLACTSRVVSECALDVLWNRLTTLRDLFNVFPSLQHRRVEDPSGTFRAGPIEWVCLSRLPRPPFWFPPSTDAYVVAA